MDGHRKTVMMMKLLMMMITIIEIVKGCNDRVHIAIYGP